MHGVKVRVTVRVGKWERGEGAKVGSWFQCFQFSAFSSVKFELSEADGLNSGEGGFDGVFAASNDEC